MEWSWNPLAGLGTEGGWRGFGYRFRRNGRIRATGRVIRMVSKQGTEFGVQAGDKTSGLLSIGARSVAVNGNMEIHGGVLIKERCVADGGCVPKEAENFQKPVRETGETRPQLMEERIEKFDEGCSAWFEEYYWAEDQTGNEDTIKNYTFSYRTTDQYGASRYSFETPYWMELYGETACSSLATWAEPEYTYQDGETPQQPWPGYDTWSKEESLTKTAPKLYDSATGIDKDRAEEENTEVDTEDSEPEKAIPNEYLKIIDPS